MIYQQTIKADFFRSFAELLRVKEPDSAVEDSVSNLPLWRQERESVREDAVFASGAGFPCVSLWSEYRHTAQ